MRTLQASAYTSSHEKAIYLAVHEMCAFGCSRLSSTWVFGLKQPRLLFASIYPCIYMNNVGKVRTCHTPLLTTQSILWSLETAA